MQHRTLTQGRKHYHSVLSWVKETDEEIGGAGCVYCCFARNVAVDGAGYEAVNSDGS